MHIPSRAFENNPGGKWYTSPPLPPVERYEAQYKDIENQTSNVKDKGTWWKLVRTIWKRLFSLWPKIEAPTPGESTSDTTIVSIDQPGLDSQIIGPTMRTPSLPTSTNESVVASDARPASVERASTDQPRPSSPTSTNESVVASDARPASVEPTSAANDGDLSDTRPSSREPCPGLEIHHPPTLEEMYPLVQNLGSPALAVNMQTQRLQRESASNTIVAPTDQSSHIALPPPKSDEPTPANVETQKLVDPRLSCLDVESEWFEEELLECFRLPTPTPGQPIGQVRRESRTIPQFSR
jgi:hypothetical protein